MYTIKAIRATWFKQSVAQSSTLPARQKTWIHAGQAFPLSGFRAPASGHIRFSLGKDKQGHQLFFQGLNTWYAYKSDVQILRDGKPIATPTIRSSSGINSAGLNLIKHFEGIRLSAYNDGVGVPTIGYGHTGPDVYYGLTITQARANQLLVQDLRRFEDAVHRAVKVVLNDNQFAALVSFTYNVGEAAFQNSTLLQLLNARDYNGASAQFLRWTYAGGQQLAGLYRRRQAERALFRSENYTQFL
jgi:lysozyme